MGTTSRRVGVFGGTFDPPHLGHLLAAERVRDELGLDEVRFVVANNPWQKDGVRQVSDAEDRLALTSAALIVSRCDESASASDDASGLVASRVEIDAGGPSFTIDTLTRFAEREPGNEWFVIVGQDAALGLDTWHRAEELRKIANIVVVNRPDGSRREKTAATVPPGWRYQNVSIPAIDISSTEIRNRVAARRSVRFLTPDPVIALITELGIYRSVP